MKIIHTSDWHVGQNFKRYERDDEHQHFFSQLALIMSRERPDALVVSGDIYHTSAPSASAMRTLTEGVIALRDASPDTVIVITAGNHDSGVRLDAQRQLWHRLGIHVLGANHRGPDGLTDPSQYVVEVPGKGYILAVPFFNKQSFPLTTKDTPSDERQRAFFAALLRHIETAALPIVMMAHLAVQGCSTQGHEEDMLIGGFDQQELDELGTGYDYLALGHIHKPQAINQRVYYCGSPLPVSFNEGFYEHYVNVVEIARRGTMPQVRQIGITPLRQFKTLPQFGGSAGEALEALRQLPDDDDSYVRLLIDQDEPLAIDYEDRVRQITDSKACRFCEIHFKPRAIEGDDYSDLRFKNLQEFVEIHPLDIARAQYQRMTGMEMDPVLVEMMENVIDRVKNGNTIS